MIIAGIAGLSACGPKHNAVPNAVPVKVSYGQRPAHSHTFRCVEVIPGDITQDTDRYIMTEVEHWARHRLPLQRNAPYTLSIRVYFQSHRVDPVYTSTWQRFTYNAVEHYTTTLTLVCTRTSAVHANHTPYTVTLKVQDSLDLPQHYSINQRTAAWQYKIQQWLYNLDEQLAQKLR